MDNELSGADDMEICPCGSEKTYEDCCRPLIRGERPAQTAEELMRSRYTAHAKVELDYVVDTTATGPREKINRKQLENWTKNAQWMGLQILRTQAGGPEDEEGTVEFTASYREKAKKIEHREIAEFKKTEGRWYFVDGHAPKPEQMVRQGPKIGRNDPCPCGSGKKHKKCCGA
jgi:SEC-C motif domain protein